MPESSKIIVSAGVTRKCSIARQYPSGSGFCFSTSSPVTIKPNHSRTPKCSSTSVAFCLLPVVTQVGLSLGTLICGAVVAEKMFSIPGIGSLIVDRINFKDEPVIIAGTILIAVCFTLVMLVVAVCFVAPFSVRKPHGKALIFLSFVGVAEIAYLICVIRFLR